MMKLVVSAVMVMAIVGTVDCVPVCDSVFCAAIYLPVCGTDGKTYSNACMLGSINCGKNVQVAHNGSCETDVVPCNSFVACTQEWNPVCGTDGVTYSNNCEFTSQTCGKNGVSIAYDGECEPDVVPCNSFVACTYEWDPVCGTDGVTYSNNCEFTSQTCGKNGVSIAYYGECEPDVIPCNSFVACTYEWDPVCGTDGVTYSNNCEFTSQTCGRKNVSIDYDGVCLFEVYPCDSFVACTDDWNPVCGTDGVTYSNHCEFTSQTCGRNDVSIDYYGQCGRQIFPCDSFIMCTDNWAPVCGTDGVTYANDCYFLSQTCGRDGVSIAYNGSCEVPDTPCDIFVMCTEEYEPICGSDGITYANSCFFKSQTCGKDIFIAHQGTCETIDDPCNSGIMCTDNYLPVCGVDGVTYSNECSMNSQTCGKVAKAHEGKC